MKSKTTTDSQDHIGKQFLKDMEKVFSLMSEIFNFKERKEKQSEILQPTTLEFLKSSKAGKKNL